MKLNVNDIDTYLMLSNAIDKYIDSMEELNKIDAGEIANDHFKKQLEVAMRVKKELEEF